jgi:hypothetical protein
MVSSPSEYETLQHQLQERQQLIQQLAQELVEANVKIRALETASQLGPRVGSATEYEETLNQQIHLLTEENRMLRQQVNRDPQGAGRNGKWSRHAFIQDESVAG